MKKIAIALLLSVSLFSTTSCKKELEPAILGRWEVIQLTEPDRTVYNLYGSSGHEENAWLKQITFSFYSWKGGRRENGAEAQRRLGVPAIQHFDWTQATSATYFLVDPVTRNFNTAVVEFMGQDRMVMTETNPVFRQYVFRFVGK